MHPLTLEHAAGRVLFVVVGVAIAIEALVLAWRDDENTPSPRHAWECSGSFLGFIGVGAALLPVRYFLYDSVAGASPLSWSETLPTTTWFWRTLALYVAVDLAYYAKHRWLHTSALGQRLHEPHHSADQFTLFVAIRLSWTERLIADVFFLPLALLGAPGWLMLTVIAANHVSPFFSHTTLVPRLGLLDGWLNTPAVHREHHAWEAGAVNLGATFLVWDRLLGTYRSPRDGDVPLGESTRRGVLALQLGALAEVFGRPNVASNTARNTGTKSVSQSG